MARKVKPRAGMVTNRSYKNIFVSDPLLLDEKNQGIFSSILLNQIFNRGKNKTFLTQDIDLMSREDRQQLGDPVSTAPVYGPTEKLRAYYKRKQRREALGKDKNSDDHLRQHTILCDGEKTKQRYTDFPTITKINNPPETIRIAAISYQVTISKHIEKTHLNEHLSLIAPESLSDYGLRPTETKSLKELGRTVCNDTEIKWQWLEQISGLLNAALGRNPQVVCLPEFALPPRSDNISDEVLGKLTAICEQSSSDDFLLFTGSRHEGVYNRGAVIMRQSERVSEPLWHYKIASSRPLGENILGPRTNKLPSYNLVYHQDNEFVYELRTRVAICFDAFDPTVFLSLINQRRTELNNDERLENGKLLKRYELILVPSFNPSSKFVDVIRDLSFLTNSMVLYVNSAHGDATLFIGGFRLLDIVNKDKDTMIINNVEEKLKHLTERSNTRNRMSESDRMQLNNRIIALTALRNTLQEIPEDQIQSMISVEECQKCKSMAGEAHPCCNHDILYFDIPHKLLEAITLFRSNYFSERRFLPPSLITGKTLQAIS